MKHSGEGCIVPLPDFSLTFVHLAVEQWMYKYFLFRVLSKILQRNLYTKFSVSGYHVVFLIWRKFEINIENIRSNRIYSIIEGEN